MRSNMLRYKARLGFVALAFAVWLTRKIRLRDVEDISFEVEPLDEMFRGFNLTETGRGTIGRAPRRRRGQVPCLTDLPCDA